MPHIHAGIDFVVSAFIVHKQQALMAHHKKLNSWMPLGGHIELDETPDECLRREIYEEGGLVIGHDVEVYQSIEDVEHRDRIFPNDDIHNSKTLLRPWAIDIHGFPPLPGHRHVAFVYLCHSSTNTVEISNEHNDMRWFDWEGLDKLVAEGVMNPRVRAYGHAAIKEIDWYYGNQGRGFSGPCALHGLPPKQSTT